MLEHLRCPRCRGTLSQGPSFDDGSGLLLCGCETAFPVLAGVPILVPEPALYLHQYRDAVLATLAESGLATPEAVQLVLDFGAACPGGEPLRFGDDWVEDEVSWPEPVAGAPEALRRLIEEAHGAPERAIEELLGGPFERVAELGCGAGLLTRRLRSRHTRVLACDLSLRAVLRAGLPGLVLDAEALPLAGLDALVAANLIDLLDEPGLFLEEALETAGRVVLSTPEAELVSDAQETRAAVPWLRPHGPAEWQLYLLTVARYEPR
jgi:SAM-dependent methyltransferase